VGGPCISRAAYEWARFEQVEAGHRAPSSAANPPITATFGLAYAEHRLQVSATLRAWHPPYAHTAISSVIGARGAKEVRPPKSSAILTGVGFPQLSRLEGSKHRTCQSFPCLKLDARVSAIRIAGVPASVTRRRVGRGSRLSVDAFAERESL
jgi:hypothetical protein